MDNRVWGAYDDYQEYVFHGVYDETFVKAINDYYYTAFEDAVQQVANNSEEDFEAALAFVANYSFEDYEAKCNNEEYLKIIHNMYSNPDLEIWLDRLLDYGAEHYLSEENEK